MATATKTSSAKTTSEKATDGLTGLVDTIQKGQKAALDSTRKLVDSINASVPELIEDGPRTKVIDAAFDMTGKIMDASNDLTRKLVGAVSPATAS